MEMEEKERSLRDRVRQQLLELISHMDFEYSTRLLSENQLAAKFQVSRSTIRAVLSELETEGKVIRRHGSGTYVNPPALDVETTIYPRVNMYDLIRKNGYEPGLKVLSFQDVPAGERGPKLNLFPFDRVTEVRSIYYANERPCMYCIDCVDARRFAGMDWKDHEKFAGSIYDYIRQATGVRLPGTSSISRPPTAARCRNCGSASPYRRGRSSRWSGWRSPISTSRTSRPCWGISISTQTRSA